MGFHAPGEAMMSEQDDKGKVGGYVHERHSAALFGSPHTNNTRCKKPGVGAVDCTRNEAGCLDITLLIFHLLGYKLKITRLSS